MKISSKKKVLGRPEAPWNFFGLPGATGVLSVSCLTLWLSPLLSKTITGGPFVRGARRSRRKGRACFAVARQVFQHERIDRPAA
jgi:hypothetical protein